MKQLLSTLLFLFIIPINSAMANEAPKVVVSIKPIHSLVTAIMDGVATPTLIIKKGSPHGYSLRPSEAKALAKADLVVWVGHELESFLEKPLETLAKNSDQLTLSTALQSSLLKTRTGEDWDEHHEEHGHDADEHKEHDHAAHEHEEHEEHAGHHHGVMDLHIWLSPKIAQKIVIATTAKLVKIDPSHAQQYKANSTKVLRKLIALDNELSLALLPVQDKPYLAFHSAYQYFEAAYNLNAVGSVTIDPDRKPGVKGISEIRQRVKDTNAVCVFSEPQFESRLVATIIEGTSAKTGTLDPLGSNIPAGPEAYFTLMHNLASNLIAGLK